MTVWIALALLTVVPVDAPKIPGWERVGETRTFSPEELWRYIDGAAEQILDYGFQELESCDLSSDSLKVTVDIYNMGGRLNAFGIYQAQRPPERGEEAIGVAASIIPPYACLLLKDVYYVKISAYEGEITEASGRDLLGSVAAELPGSNERPGELERLPLTHRIPGSERFTPRGYLGVGELTNCLQATYRKDEEETYQVFLLLPGAGRSEEDAWKALAAKWTAREHRKHRLLLRQIPYQGTVGVLRTETGILGLTGSPNEKEAAKRLVELARLSQ